MKPISFSLKTFLVFALLVSMVFSIAVLQNRVNDLETVLSNAYASYNLLPIPLDEVRSQVSDQLNHGYYRFLVTKVEYIPELSRYELYIYQYEPRTDLPKTSGIAELYFDPPDGQFFGRYRPDPSVCLNIKIPKTYDPRRPPTVWNKRELKFTASYNNEIEDRRRAALVPLRRRARNRPSSMIQYKSSGQPSFQSIPTRHIQTQKQPPRP